MSDLKEIQIKQDLFEKELANQREISKSTNQILSKVAESLNEFTQEVRIQNEQNKYRDRDHEKLVSRVERQEAAINEIKNVQSENKPAIEIVKSINNRVWFIIVAAIAMALSNVYGVMK